MRVLAIGFACVLVLCGAAPSYAQQTGPRTLENLLNSDEAQKPTAAAEAAGADATDAGTKRPAGTLVRPKDGVQHPDLDKAWADYDAAVGKVTESIKGVINKQFDAATAKGNLDTAEKWQNALEKFEKAGELPAESELKAAVNAAAGEYKKAKDELINAYEAVVKSLTIEKKIANAKTAREESRALDITTDKAVSASGSPVERGSKEAGRRVAFLADLPEKDAVVGYGNLGKGEELGWEGRVVRVQGVRRNKSVSMHPPHNGLARVSFEVPKGLTHFEAQAAINDGANNKTPLTFKLLGDGRLLWTSRPLHGAGSKDDCSVALKGAKTVTLVVECPGSYVGAWAVWCDPQCVAK